MRGDDRQPRLAAHRLARTSYTVALHTLHTCSRALTYEADHAGPCTAQESQENAAASEGTQVDRRVDAEHPLARGSCVVPAEIEVLPVVKWSPS